MGLQTKGVRHGSTRIASEDRGGAGRWTSSFCLGSERTASTSDQRRFDALNVGAVTGIGGSHGLLEGMSPFRHDQLVTFRRPTRTPCLCRLFF